jgi:hypothetical protein
MTEEFIFDLLSAGQSVLRVGDKEGIFRGLAATS